jgi:hypothetical protein
LDVSCALNFGYNDGLQAFRMQLLKKSETFDKTLSDVRWTKITYHDIEIVELKTYAYKESVHIMIISVTKPLERALT